MRIELSRAGIKDADKIWEMQKIAFDDLLKKYQDFDTNPANEELSKVVLRLRQPYTYFYFIVLNGKKIGAIRVVDKKDATSKRISPLFIMPEYRNRGFAQEAILQVEKIHGDCNWELDTIMQEKGNCHLYEKLGYRKTGKTKQVNSKMTLIFYSK